MVFFFLIAYLELAVLGNAKCGLDNSLQSSSPPLYQHTSQSQPVKEGAPL